MRDKVRLHMITGLVFVIICVVLLYFRLYIPAILIFAASIPDFYKAVKLSKK